MNEQDRPDIQMPPGCPDWITPEDIEETIRVWQLRSEKPLTPDDAVEILVNVRLGYDSAAKKTGTRESSQEAG